MIQQPGPTWNLPRNIAAPHFGEILATDFHHRRLHLLVAADISSHMPALPVARVSRSQAGRNHPNVPTAAGSSAGWAAPSRRLPRETRNNGSRCKRYTKPGFGSSATAALIAHRFHNGSPTLRHSSWITPHIHSVWVRPENSFQANRKLATGRRSHAVKLPRKLVANATTPHA